MSAITTHILDTSLGKPASGVRVRLEQQVGADNWQLLGDGATDADGRLRDLLAPGASLIAGRYRLTFDTGTYYVALGIESFYPEVSVTFLVADASEHYHVPLLLNPYGYSTYRGS